MGSYKRVNVGLARPLERLANYSSALRCGGMALQSGTTATVTNGDIIGENYIGAQVDAVAIKGAGNVIEWLGSQGSEETPLDRLGPG